MSRRTDPIERDILLWAVPTFVLNMVLTQGDLAQSALIAAVVTAVGVPLERRLSRY